MSLNAPESQNETPEQEHIAANQVSFHRRIGKLIGKTVEFGADVTIGTAKIGTYAVTRAIKGVFEVVDAGKQGSAGNPYPKAA